MRIKLNYPVFAFRKDDNMIYVFFNDRDLKATNEQIFHEMKYNEIIHIDSLGNQYEIIGAFKVKYLGLWGFNPLLKGRQILIEFDYSSEVRNVSLEHFKTDLVNRINKTSSIWRAGWNTDELKERIKNANSFKEIAELVK
ncbi:hypothetical protein GCM10011506_18940 [Marivirga lumbricoides]|uniref:Uncharacterized protein n=1 Tax=Marivirga lumbricoides TaxID=1046115 RepID=A0A2T4DSF0_9BACT|nr:hypothetical protein C9994_06485 [Marivirga lumbricoides]GGC33709.1 hypothetical protein GCM10011506_18940 [Marivirga lumbricoides]